MKFAGVNKLKRKLRALPAIAREEIHGALQQSAVEMVEAARNFAPVKSGDLRNSIGYTFGKYSPENSNVRGVGVAANKLNDPDLTVTIHAGDAKAFYAAFVEFGTAAHTIKPKRPGGLLNIFGRTITKVEHPGAAARPFFFPAWRLVKKKAKGRISRATNKAAKKVAAGG
ncbi:MAG: HK97 gp10 family phage protein [Mesorhizobium sp.]|nr:HK97-gp10 family putative phage morphogenesis protein [Mesorhizobium sp.]MBN9243940.1 HK97 gp10 family phage protein [Mesorhizobium sp.]